MSRRVAREIAVQLLYQIDFENVEPKEQIEIFLSNVIEEKIHNDKPLKDFSDSDIIYVKEVVLGVLENLLDIDKRINILAQGWNVERIAKVDLAILRLAIYEITKKEDVPKQVAINEAVEIAKKYSTMDSKSFVNGILGKVDE